MSAPGPPADSPRPTARARAGLLPEWGLLALVLLALVAWLVASASLRRVDHLVHDQAMRWRALAPSQDIAIIAIDDASIAAIGRWPWRRALHAQVLRAVSAQAPRAVALDILFGEPDADYPGDDLLLARAITLAGNVVLPVARRGGPVLGGTADVPLARLREAAAQLGHVQVEVDEDGAVRRFFAREGPAEGPWPHVSQALRCAAGESHPACRGNAAAADGPWTRSERRGITFTAGRPAFPTHSYVDVLKGQLAPDALRGKFVLVGATATGLGDMFAAPGATRAGRVAGVQLLAHALHGALAGAPVRRVGLAADLAFNLLPVALALLALVRLGPLAGLWCCALLALAAVLVATLAAPWGGWELSVAPALAGLALSYPLWSWRRLSAAARFLQAQMQALERQMPLAEAPPDLSRGYGDALEERIVAVEGASERLRRLHYFVSESLHHLPLPALVCADDGRVLLANTAAERHFAQPNDILVGQPAHGLLRPLADPRTGRPIVDDTAWSLRHAPPRQEGRDAQGRDVLVLCQHHGLDGRNVHIVTLVDLTAIRHAQRQRDQALDFISHDIRGPAVSILTLLEMHRELDAGAGVPHLLQRIERHAQASLALAQGFLQLARAQSDDFQPVVFDLAQVLHAAMDQAHETAHAKDVRLVLDTPAGHAPTPVPIEGMPDLVRRAIANVLGNAVKFSPQGGTVRCAVQRHGDRWGVAIHDAGPGIAPDVRDRMFEPFQQQPAPDSAGESRAEGVGLGLAFVDVVMRRHGGGVEVDSAPGQGARFVLWFPACRTGLSAGRD